MRIEKSLGFKVAAVGLEWEGWEPTGNSESSEMPWRRAETSLPASSQRGWREAFMPEISAGSHHLKTWGWATGGQKAREEGRQDLFFFHYYLRRFWVLEVSTGLQALGSDFHTPQFVRSVIAITPDSATPRTVAHQAPLSMWFSRQGYWNGLPCPPSGDLPNPGIKPRSPAAPALRHTLYPLVINSQPHWVTVGHHTQGFPLPFVLRGVSYLWEGKVNPSLQGLQVLPSPPLQVLQLHGSFSSFRGRPPSPQFTLRSSLLSSLLLRLSLVNSHIVFHTGHFPKEVVLHWPSTLSSRVMSF